jgi:hypothetical protein
LAPENDSVEALTKKIQDGGDFRVGRKSIFHLPQMVYWFIGLMSRKMIYTCHIWNMQNLNSLASTQTDIAKFWTFFQENIRIFQKILK